VADPGPAIRTAVVGVGSLGRHHLKWLAEIDSSQLVGLYDVDRDKAASYAERYGVRAFDSLDDLADVADAVSIVVPTTAHHDVASRLIEHGVHCLIEKPIVADIAQAEAIAVLARKRGVKVTVGQIERFNPAVRALDDIDIAPSFIEAHRLAAFDPRGTDVAVVLDLMIHDIDLVLRFVNHEVTDIQASAVAVVSEQADIANARLTFANGAVANLTASRISLRPMRKLRMFQKSGYFSLDLAAKQADLYRLAAPDKADQGMRIPLGKSGHDILYTKISDSGDDMLAQELSAFIDAVRRDQPVAVSVEQAINGLKVALRIEEIGLSSIRKAMEHTAT
jgi:predicted dehydrogenase